MYDEKLAQRIRKALANLPNVEEKKMFRGLTFMVNGKMCISVSGDELMCRFDPQLQETVEKRPGFRTMLMGGRQYKGYGYVSQNSLKTASDFNFWVKIALDYNPLAKSSKTKSPKTKKLKP